LLSGFLAQGMDAADAAVCAAYIHGDAGDICAERLSQRGMTTEELINHLPLSLKKYCWE
jgi:NAD(P)H-hydrate epimerase